MKSLSNQDIQILIIDDSRAEKCDIGCGIDWSSPENMGFARQRIKENFGNSIILDYVDMAKPAISPLISELRQRLSEDNLPLPVLTINGKSRIYGQFDTRMLLDAINAEVEINPAGKEDDDR